MYNLKFRGIKVQEVLCNRCSRSLVSDSSVPSKSHFCDHCGHQTPSLEAVVAHPLGRLRPQVDRNFLLMTDPDVQKIVVPEDDDVELKQGMARI